MQTYEKLHKAMSEKNDEFYTRYEDIEKEICFYKKYLKNKTVYCNSDSTKSNFFKYFYKNFKKLSLKRLIITWYNPASLSLFKKTNKSNGGYIDINKENYPNYSVKSLKGNGDFRSYECISLF